MIYIIMNDEYDEENEIFEGYTKDKDLAIEYAYNKKLSTGTSYSVVVLKEITDPGNRPDFVTVMTFYTIDHKTKTITTSSIIDIGDLDEMPKEGILFDEPNSDKSLSVLNKVYFRIESNKIPKNIDLMTSMGESMFTYVKNTIKMKYPDYDVIMHIPSTEY